MSRSTFIYKSCKLHEIRSYLMLYSKKKTAKFQLNVDQSSCSFMDMDGVGTKLKLAFETYFMKLLESTW